MKKLKRDRDNGFEGWGGYMAAKISKLEGQFDAEVKNFGLKEDDLFNGISIFVNGYTVPPAYELRNLMMKHGGTFHHYYRPYKTTYVVASNLPDSKLKQVNKLTVVKPEWVTGSIKAGRLLNHKDYLLYTNQSITQPLLNFEKPANSEPKNSTKTAKDDKFLSEFYNNSRLHLISTMGATFKRYVNELRSKSSDFSGQDELMTRVKINEEGDQEKISGWGTIIMHIDMDCFFVSVSIRQRPDLVGQPVAVTHSKGNKPSSRAGVNPQAEYKAYRGSKSSDPNHWSNAGESFSMSEIASCSYEARKAGVKNGMLMGQALTLCPTLVTLPYDFEGYKEVAKILYDTVARYSLNIEAVSCDEMFVDCTELLTKLSMTPLEFASIIRREIKEKTQCPCSTGFGSNKLQARLATRKAKPDGQFFLEPDTVLEFMLPIPVSDLPGVGRSTTYKLKSFGVSTCAELQKMSLQMLKKEFGSKAGETLYNYAYGRDSKGLTFEKIRKSISAEVNYGIRFQLECERDKFLKQLSEEVSNRLIEVSMKGKSITLKIMVKSKDAPEETAKFLGHGACDYFTKTNSLKSHTDDPVTIYREVLSIMAQFNVPTKDLRGVGIQMTKLTSDKCLKNNLNKFFIKPNKHGQGNVNNATDPEGLPNKINVTVDNLKCSTNNVISEDTSSKNKSADYKILSDPQPGTSKCSKSREIKSSCVDKKKVDLKNMMFTSESIQPDLHALSFSQIDPCFLDALPKELRSEIVGAIKKKNNQSEKSENILSGMKNVPNIFTGINNTSENPESTSNEKNEGDVLSSQISPLEMRRLIKEWVNSCSKPEKCDVSMFTGYLISLVTKRNIDQLFILLKTFFRLIKTCEKSPEWMTCYETTLDEVQNKMLGVYGAKLVHIK